jgi:Uma2 family endonuclease
MVSAGIIHEDERFELIGGEAVPLAPKSVAHERVKAALAQFWAPRLPKEIIVAIHTTLRADHDTFFEPDFTFCPRAIGLEGLNAATALLVVEIADDSLAFDLGRKAGLYAAHDLQEVWVIDANTLGATIFREPYDGAYEARGHIAADRPLALPFAPGVATALKDLTFP